LLISIEKGAISLVGLCYTALSGGAISALVCQIFFNFQVQYVTQAALICVNLATKGLICWLSIGKECYICWLYVILSAGLNFYFLMKLCWVRCCMALFSNWPIFSGPKAYFAIIIELCNLKEAYFKVSSKLHIVIFLLGQDRIFNKCGLFQHLKVKMWLISL
jgi:hypothetical protein